jgi:hypothetical protein
LESRFFFSRTLELDSAAGPQIEAETSFHFQKVLSSAELKEHQQTLLDAGLTKLLVMGLAFEGPAYEHTRNTLREFQALHMAREGRNFPVALLPGNVFEKEAIPDSVVSSRLLHLAVQEPIHRDIFQNVQMEDALRQPRIGCRRVRPAGPLSAERLLQFVTDPALPHPECSTPQPQLPCVATPPRRGVVLIYD